MLALLCLISTFAAPIGCVALWRRCIYLADGLAHAAILSVALSQIIHVNVFLVSLVVGAILMLFIYWFEKENDIYIATTIVVSAAVAIAILLHSFQHSCHIHGHPHNCISESILSGKIENITRQDMIIALVFGGANFLIVLFNLRAMILMAFNRHIAKVLGVRVALLDIIYFISCSLFLNIAVKALGLLLISSVLIFPALLARLVSNSPRTMIIISIVLGATLSFIAYCIQHCILPQIPIAVLICLCNVSLLSLVYCYKAYIA